MYIGCWARLAFAQRQRFCQCYSVMGRVAGRCGEYFIFFSMLFQFLKVDISFVSAMCREFCSNVAILFKEPYTVCLWR